MAKRPLTELLNDSSRRNWRGTRRDRFNALCSPAANGCIERGGYRDKDGYPIFCTQERTVRASHAALALAGIDVPEGGQVNHHCDNRQCVNPDHLFIGSQRDNVHDMMAKDRHAVGERHTISKLTDDAVRDIRANCTEVGQPKLFAAKYGVRVSTIWAARSRQNWKHVDV